MIHALLLAVGLSQSSCQPEALLISNGQVFIDGQFTQANILLEDGVISAVGKELSPQAATTTLDATGKLVIPGLVDAHAHMFELGGPYPPAWDEAPYDQAFEMNGRALLASGVTSARIHLFDLEYGPKLKVKSTSPCHPSPRLQIGGPGLFGSRPGLQGRQVRGISSTDDARNFIQRAAKSGIDWLALHNIDAFPQDQLETIVDTARMMGVRLMAEGATMPQVRLAIENGVDSIEYLPKETPYPADVIEQLLNSSIPVAAPIGFYQRIASAIDGDSAYATIGLPAFLPKQYRLPFASNFDAWLADDAYYTEAPAQRPIREESFKQLVSAGITLLPATDAGSAGQYHDRAIWNELAAWQALGLEIDSILNSATEDAANALGLPNTGRIAVGATADLVVVDAADPESMQTWQPVLTIKGGIPHRIEPECPLPPARSGHVLVTTETDTWLFGGYIGDRALKDIWQRSSDGCWHKGRTDVPFVARTWQTVSYDLARDTFVFFGGKSMQREPFADTWLWDGENWRQYAGASPAPRSHHTQVYDPEREVTVLFGGDDDGRLFNDVWEWDGEQWHEVLAENPPPPRAAHMSAFDPTRKKVIVFGGVAPDNTTRLDDVWAWDGHHWQALPAMPAPRALAGASTIPTGVAMLGGWEEGYAPLGELWMLETDGWRKADAETSPRAAAAISWLENEKRLLVHGGSDRNFVALADQIKLHLLQE